MKTLVVWASHLYTVERKGRGREWARRGERRWREWARAGMEGIRKCEEREGSERGGERGVRGE